MSGVLSKFKVF